MGLQPSNDRGSRLRANGEGGGADPEGLALPGMRLTLTAVFEDLRLRGSDADKAGREISLQSPDPSPAQVWLGALERCGLVGGLEIARGVKSVHEEDPHVAAEILKIHLENNGLPYAEVWMRAQRNLDRQSIRSATIQMSTRTTGPSRI
jgi:hypothetical protein